MTYDPLGSVLGVESTTSPKDFLKLQILQRRENLIDAFESHDRIDGAGAASPDHVVRARFKAYYRQLSSFLRTQSEEERKEKSEKWWAAIENGDIGDMHLAYEELDAWLYEKGLLNFENQLRPSRPTAEGWNRERSFG